MSYETPIDLQSALESLSQNRRKIIAGGTDIYPAMTPANRPTAYLDLTRIKGLNRIETSASGTRIGATATWSDLIAADLPPGFDALKQAGHEVGSVQIQNAGTIAGNLCNASPAADGVPPLLTLGAEVELASITKTRTIPLDQFLIGPRATALQPDEIVTAICIPPRPAHEKSAFAKLGSRRYLVISICMTAVNLAMDPDGRLTWLRVAVGACAPVAQRLRQLEADLLGRRWDEVAVNRQHLAPLNPIDDLRGSGIYRLDAVATQIARTIQKAAAA